MEPGRYETQDEIGQGGMGRVMRVRDRYLDRDVAVKMLLPELKSDQEFVNRFVREARAVGKFEHPNIPPVHELGKGPDGTPYFTMRLVEGDCLIDVIIRLHANDPATHAAYTFTRRLQVIQEVCDALSYVHQQGFLHRDIKPDNIMIGRHGEVQLMDWGLTRSFAEESGSKPNLTQAGSFVGTPAFAAPEQIAGDSPDPRADLYALGVVMYQLFTYELPFKGETAQEILTSSLTSKPRPPESYVKPIQGRVPREISKVILKTMASRREDRFASADELKQAIQKVIEGEAPVVCPHTAYKRGLTRFQRFLDNHHSAPFILLVYLWTALPFLLGGWLVYLYAVVLK